MVKKIENNEEFKKFINTPNVISVVKFGAPWCGPCHVMSDVLNTISNDAALSGAQFGDVNVDDLEDLSIEYNIRNIPVLLFFKDGEVVNRTVGIIQQSELIKMISSL